MKKLVIITLIAILGLHIQVAAQSQQDAITRFFSQYENDEKFTNIYISGKMFSMFSDIPVDEDEQDVREAIQQLKGLRILSSDSVDGIKLYNEAFRMLDGKNFEELMVIRDGQQQLKFLIQEDDGIISELLMLSGEENSFFILSLIGNIDLEQISKLSKTMDVKGMENLENLNKDKGKDKNKQKNKE